MVRIEKDYVLEGPDGKQGLVDLFEGPSADPLPFHVARLSQVAGGGCPGCSFFVDQISHLAHLHARDTSFFGEPRHR